MLDRQRQDPELEQLAACLSESVMSDPEIQRWVKIQALREAEIDPGIDLVSLEGTHQYKVYWNAYARFQSVLVLRTAELLL